MLLHRRLTRARLVLAAVLAGSFIAVLDSSIVNVAVSAGPVKVERQHPPGTLTARSARSPKCT